MNDDMEKPTSGEAGSCQPGSRRQVYQPIGETVSIFRRGKIWYVNYQVNGRQHRNSLATTSMKEARRRAIQVEAEIANGRFKASREVTTIAEAVVAYKEYLRVEKRAPRTIAKYDMVLDRMATVAEDIKAKSLDRLNLAFIDRYRALRVKRNAAPKTIYGETVIIRQLVNFAISRDLVFQDPLKGLKLKKPKPSTQPCWTIEETRRILAEAPECIRGALTLLAETGMRFGELAWLTWDDVDIDGNALLIRPKEGWTPKTGDRRMIPISPVAREVLDALPRRWRWVVTMPPTRQRPQPGRQWSERRLLTALGGVLRKLRLKGKLHTFRHFFISNSLLNGIPTATVRAWVGHVDEEIIKLYTHIHDEASQAAMQRLARANHPPLQQKEFGNGQGGTESGSAQNQHSTKEASCV